MAKIIGNIDSLGGKFYARAADGSLRELSQGDAIYQGEVVVGDNFNQTMDSIIVAMNDGYNIVLRANQSQAFDTTLYENEFAQNETVTETNTILSMLEESGDLTQKDIEDIETAAGEEGGVESTEGGSAIFAQSNGAFTDVNANLRDTNMPNSEPDASGKLDQSEEIRRAAANLDTDPIVAEITQPTISTEPEVLTVETEAASDAEVAAALDAANDAADTANQAIVDAQSAADDFADLTNPGDADVTAVQDLIDAANEAIETAQEAAQDYVDAATEAGEDVQNTTPIGSTDDAQTTLNDAVAAEAASDAEVAAALDAANDAATAANTAADAANDAATVANDAASAADAAAAAATQNPTVETITAAETAQTEAADAATAAQETATAANDAADAAQEALDAYIDTATAGNEELSDTTSITDAISNANDAAANANDAADRADTAANAGVVGIVTVDAITADNIINADEKDGMIVVTGSAGSGSVSAGDEVNAVINGELYTSTVAEDGTFSFEVDGAELAADTKFTVTVTSSSTSGNILVSSTTSTYSVDLDAPDAPTITNIVDVNGDYSEVTLYGTGEADETITLYARANSTTGGNTTQTGEYVAVATAVVSADGTWSVDISALDDVPVNDNEFFKAIQIDVAGNASEYSNTTHYYHGTYNNAWTEDTDDFVFLGDGNDTVHIDKAHDGYQSISGDNANDYLVIDGGNGNDTAIFGGNLEDYTITKNENGHLLVQESKESDSTGNGVGDITELRNFETIKFADGEFTIEEMLERAEDTSASAAILSMDISDAQEVIDTKEVIDEDATANAGIDERDGAYYKTEIQEVETEVVDLNALREMGYTIGADGKYYTINEDGAKIQIEQEVQKPVTKVIDAEPIMKDISETTTVKTIGQEHEADGAVIPKGKGFVVFEFAEPTKNIEIDFANFNRGTSKISFVDFDDNQIGREFNTSHTNGTRGYSVPEGAIGVKVENRDNSSDFEVESISYRGIDQEVTVEAGGLVPDTDAMEVSGIVWMETESETLTQNSLGQSVGTLGDANVRGFNPEHSVKSDIFDFGTDKAFQKVTIAIDVDVKGTWDFNDSSTNDIFTVSANGDPLAAYNYTSDFQDSNFIFWQSKSDYTKALEAGHDIQKIGKHTYEYEVYLDENGQVELDFMVASTDWREIVNVESIEVHYDGKSGYVQTVTEIETFKEVVFVDAPNQQVDPSTIDIPMKTVYVPKEVEVETQPIMTSTTVTVGYEYTVELRALLSDTDGSETLSSITLSGLPEGVSVKDLKPNEDGTYSIDVDKDGDANLVLVSNEKLSNVVLQDIEASVTSTESNGGQSATVTVNIDGELESSYSGTEENDTLKFDTSFSGIDGAAEYDTLLIEDNQTIDFGGLSEKISNIERIDLGEGSQTISLSLKDVLSMTDDNNVLRIDGDESDIIYLKDAGESVENDGYKEYTSGEGDSTVTLQISTNITVEES